LQKKKNERIGNWNVRSVLVEHVQEKN